MVSVASGGTADLTAARSLVKVLRVACGTLARYSSTFFGPLLSFPAELPLRDFTFVTHTILQEPPPSASAPWPNIPHDAHHEECQENDADHITASRHEKGISLGYSVVVILVTSSNRPGSRPICAANASVIICTGRISRIG